ncbi:bifunctional UDP-sugar hydrolase/5'-nucleotidase [Parendozoicomonas sp. Alg238-R29]|uniref:bifunctional metallophosphatase/5'-nucleotidase n=1 Tax=Parendozoicomonas sp. Alg238-R29 TaxID=2993446 RepID=UPI00248D4CD6|nr:bifunctional UDP-sugar hydrolase/5'-nucleotidase [Parendozoicomonas sp. Alg238-R29]
MTLLQRFFLVVGLSFSSLLMATGQSFTVLHTNDWQSRLLGFGPNTEYTPETINDDKTIGGVARLATLIDQRRRELDGQPVLLLDGGDISQGTLFHTLYRKHAPELRLMRLLGYDALTLGNHEFDFRPDGLSKMLDAAKGHLDEIPAIITSNLELPPAQRYLQDNGTIQKWKIIEKNGIRFGLFGLIGKEADEVSPNAKPAVFAEQIATAKFMVRLLREEQKADVVILMSHSGVVKNEDGGWEGEEIEYARQVHGIDVIVGGHSHTALHEPIMVNGTPVLQAGSDTRYLGEISLELEDNGKVAVKGYKLHTIDDQIIGKNAVTEKVNTFKALIDQEVMAGSPYSFNQPLVKTPKTLTRAYDDQVLGNLVTDGIRKAAGSDVAMTTNSLIRDDMLMGDSGIQSVSDIFRLQPLGVGNDNQPGYPLMKVWMTAQELRGLMEIMSFAYLIKGDDYFPRLSGLRFTYNKMRPPLDRITSIELGSHETGFTPLDLTDKTRLYSFSASSYVGSFAWVMKDLSYGLVSIIPKDKNGNPLADLKLSIVDRLPAEEGIQEYKNWQAQLDFFASLPDTDGDGIANIVLNKNVTEPRMQTISSFKPDDLLRNATWILWTVTGLLFTILLILFVIGFRTIGRIKKNG